MAECIHGLEVPLCDLCYPKAVPEVIKPVRSSGPRVVRTPGVSTTRKSVNAAQQRIYHVTHISNLEGILDADAIVAGTTPTVDLSTALTRELRETTEASPGASVASHVSFYLSPAAALWEQLRDGALDETRWSDQARATTPADFVFLVSTVSQLGDSVVVTDGDAAGSLTRFASGDGVRPMLEKLYDTEAAKDAEALVPGSFPFSGIQLIGVANDRVRDRVRDLTPAKVAVYPPWFVPAE